MTQVYLVKFSDEQGDWWLEDRPQFRFFSDSYRDGHAFKCREAAAAAKELVSLRVPGRRARVVAFKAQEG